MNIFAICGAVLPSERMKTKKRSLCVHPSSLKLCDLIRHTSALSVLGVALLKKNPILSPKTTLKTSNM
jgi:hypothetical protein